MSETTQIAKTAEEQVIELKAFIRFACEVIQGGDRLDSLEPWARKIVEEGRKLLR